MLSSTRKLLQQKLGNQIIKNWMIHTVFPGSTAKKYALLNKAFQKKELIRVHRGIYILGTPYRSNPISQFVLANQMVSRSFVSFETALAFHGWIPEKVTTIMSAIARHHSKNFETPFGTFEYIKTPVHDYEFLSGVSRNTIVGQPFLIANPLRALMDYVYHRHLKWTGLHFLTNGLRIELESLQSLQAQDFDLLENVYHSKRVLLFLHQFRKSLELKSVINA